MPYITAKQRLRLHEGGIPQNAGELNYWITVILRQYIEENGESYQTYNDIIGALEGAKIELYERKIRDYEDIKIRSNGDVFEGKSSNTNLAWAGGFFEGEGCFYAHWYKPRKDGSRIYRTNATLVQNDLNLLEQFKNVVKCGIIYNEKNHYVWKCSKSEECKKMFDSLRPWLGSRRQNRFSELYENEQKQDFKYKRTFIKKNK